MCCIQIQLGFRLLLWIHNSNCWFLQNSHFILLVNAILIGSETVPGDTSSTIYATTVSSVYGNAETYH
ncbi:hypothetical protein V6Z12_A12G231900 [Gossypium hirsutum]